MDNSRQRQECQKQQISEEASSQIAVQREVVARGIAGTLDLLIVGIGQCSTNVRDIDTTMSESKDISGLTSDNPGIFAMQRQNHRKPRSPRNDGTIPWRGMDTTHPNEALGLHLDTVCTGTPICSELLTAKQIEKYSDGLTMAWIGARNDDVGFALSLATEKPFLPLGIKNGTNGSLNRVFRVLELLKKGCWEHIAPSFLVDRGGTDFSTPDLWEQHILTVLDATEGKFMLDLAHGTEQAHDPEQNFGKSADAEKRALDHYIQIGERTGMWANGVLIEASDAPSDTDPNMPLKIALEGIKHIATSMRRPISADILRTTHA